MCLNKEIWLAEIFPVIEEQLNGGGSASFNIHGGSMLPLLHDGCDRVRIAKASREPKKYDIIFYRRENGEFVLHRIIGIKDECFVCRGDNQREKEFPVKKEAVIGMVTDYFRGGKWKRIDRLSQRIYARIWVNIPFLCRINWKIAKIKKEI